MTKRIIAILLACIMCLSLFMTGCSKDNENTNVNTGDNEQVSTDNNEQVSTEIISGKVDIELSDGTKVESNENALKSYKVNLAANKQLMDVQVESFFDFELYVNQGNEMVDLVRKTWSPGRSADFPVALLSNTGDLTSFTTKHYFFEDQLKGPNLILSEYVYFEDGFKLDNNSLAVKVKYMKPDVSGTAEDIFMKTTYAGYVYFAENYGDRLNHEFIDEFDTDLFENGNLLQLKEGTYSSDVYTYLPLCDEIFVRYDQNGEMDVIYVYINNVYITITHYSDGELTPFSDIAGQLQNGFMKYVLNEDTLALAKNILTTGIEDAASTTEVK